MESLGVRSNAPENFVRMLASDESDIPRKAARDPFCEQALQTAQMLKNAHVIILCSTLRLTCRRRGSRRSAEKIIESVRSCERKPRAAVRSSALFSEHCLLMEAKETGGRASRPQLEGQQPPTPRCKLRLSTAECGRRTRTPGSTSGRKFPPIRQARSTSKLLQPSSRSNSPHFRPTSLLRQGGPGAYGLKQRRKPALACSTLVSGARAFAAGTKSWKGLQICHQGTHARPIAPCSPQFHARPVVVSHI